MPSIVSDMKWRYATKKFDPRKKIKKKDLNEILEAIRLSPSSYGLQPWKFIIVTNRELRDKLRQYARNQLSITDASHLIIFCIRTDIDENYVKKYIELVAKTRGESIDSLQGFRDRILNMLAAKGQGKDEWTRRQAYIALGMLLSVCARKRIDACPIEGFEPEKIDKALGLKGKNLKSVVLCAIGFRGKDEYAKKKKVRFSSKDIFEFI